MPTHFPWHQVAHRQHRIKLPPLPPFLLETLQPGMHLIIDLTSFFDWLLSFLVTLSRWASVDAPCWELLFVISSFSAEFETASQDVSPMVSAASGMSDIDAVDDRDWRSCFSFCNVFILIDSPSLHSISSLCLRSTLPESRRPFHKLALWSQWVNCTVKVYHTSGDQGRGLGGEVD